jgi:hypothetical protein
MRDKRMTRLVFAVQKPLVVAILGGCGWVLNPGILLYAQQTPPALAITSPANGATVQTGQSVSVSVAASGSFSSIEVIGQAIGLSLVVNDPPYIFSLAIPNGTVGQKTITAAGITPSGTMIFSPSVTIDCEPAAPVTALSLNLNEISFDFTGDQVELTVEGKLADGSSVNLTQSSNTTYSSGNIAVATVTTSGLVTAVGPGTTTITALNGGQIAAATVSAPNSLHGDLNADGKIDADDINILLAALNTNATGSFDARDLNGDSIIDMKDVQALAALCALPGCSTSSTAVSSPRIVLSPASLPFTNQLVGTSSQSQTITVVNSGTSALTIQSIAASGDFSETNTCTAALNPETSCVIKVAFDPTASGLRSSSLIITDNAAGSPHVVGLSGTGTELAIPTVKVTPTASSITTTQALSVMVAVSGGNGNPTPTGTVTLTGGGYTSSATTLMSGSATINIPASSLSIGTDSLAISYTPDSSSSSTYNSASGTGSVTVTTAVSPTFTVSGTAVTGSAGATTGNTSMITVTPGGGFTGSVALTAALTSSPIGAQNSPTFSFVPTTPVSITSATAGTAILTISTTASSTRPCNAANQMPRGLPWQTGGGAILACIFLFGIPMRRGRWRTMLGMLALLSAMTGGVLACGGGGGTPCTPVVKPGTTAGTYTITVTGTSGALAPTGTVTLTVQ